MSGLKDSVTKIRIW